MSLSDKTCYSATSLPDDCYLKENSLFFTAGDVWVVQACVSLAPSQYSEGSGNYLLEDSVE